MSQLFVITVIISMFAINACAIEKTGPGGKRTVYSIYTDPKEAKEDHKHQVCEEPDNNGVQKCTYDNGQIFYSRPEYPKADHGE